MIKPQRHSVLTLKQVWLHMTAWQKAHGSVSAFCSWGRLTILSSYQWAARLAGAAEELRQATEAEIEYK